MKQSNHCSRLTGIPKSFGFGLQRRDGSKGNVRKLGTSRYKFLFGVFLLKLRWLFLGAFGLWWAMFFLVFHGISDNSIPSLLKLKTSGTHVESLSLVIVLFKIWVSKLATDWTVFCQQMCYHPRQHLQSKIRGQGPLKGLLGPLLATFLRSYWFTESINCPVVSPHQLDNSCSSQAKLSNISHHNILQELNAVPGRVFPISEMLIGQIESVGCAPIVTRYIVLGVSCD